MTSPDDYTRVIAGMRAAIEYARVQHSGMSGAADLADVQAALNSIAADCGRGQLDILGALASITLRAATLACQASAAAWPDRPPLTIPEFLDELERELTPPDDPSRLG